MLIARACRIARRRGGPPAPADFDLIVVLGRPEGTHCLPAELPRLHAAWDAPRRLLVAEIAVRALAAVEDALRTELPAFHGCSAWTVAVRAAGGGAWWLAARVIPSAPNAAAWPLMWENAVDAWQELCPADWQAGTRRLRDAEVARLLSVLAAAGV